MVLRRGKLSAKRKLQYAIDVANAIATLHDMDKNGRVSLVHRDIRVSNFLISRDGEHLLVHDFNCARLMARDTVSDSPCAFYKPECVQVRKLAFLLVSHFGDCCVAQHNLRNLLSFRFLRTAPRKNA
jgi:serine/threonine protein kinase